MTPRGATQWRAFIKRQLRLLRVRAASVVLRRHYWADWEGLRNRYAGQRAFLIGNGPSLNLTPLHRLKGEVTLCFNRFNMFLERLDWRPSMYMVVDGLVAKDMAHEINDMIHLVEHAFFTRYSNATGLDFKGFIAQRHNVHWMLPAALHSPFDFHLPVVNAGGSVAVAGIQVLKHLGFSEIFLVGVDMNYRIHKDVEVLAGNSIRATKDDDPNHFDPRYFGAGRAYHQPDRRIVQNIMRSFERIAAAMEGTDCRVYNATVGGRLECFPRVAFEALFDGQDGALRFKEAFAYTTGLDFDAERAAVEGGAVERMLGLPQEDTPAEIGRLIYTHLPLGPHCGCVFFVNRKLLEGAATFRES